MPGIGIGISPHFQQKKSYWATRKPSDLIVTGMRDTEIDFSWTDNSAGEASFKVYKSTDGLTYAADGTTVAGDTTYTATGLTAGNLYYFYVVGVKSGNESDPTNIYDTRFKITVDTTKAGSANNTFVFPLMKSAGVTYNCFINWGDGSAEENISGSNLDPVPHVYASPGVYQIKVRGTFPKIYFNNTGDRLKLISIDNWGNIKWGQFSKAFHGCENMVAEYIDVPNILATGMSFDNAFCNCYKFNGKVNWDTSSVVNFGAAFRQCEVFDQPVQFNTSAATIFSAMFYGCYIFNQSVSTFDTSKATDMHAMFRYCRLFNQPVPFDTALNTDFNQFFADCNVFNQSVLTFDTGECLAFNSMFSNCWAFNQPVDHFDTSKGVNFEMMFNHCYVFNQAVPFDTSSCAGATGSMISMFNNCKVFNQAVEFDTSGVTNMSSMFGNCWAFNQVINFDLTACTNITRMFDTCTNLNSNITLSNFTGTLGSFLFSNCAKLNSTISINTANITDMQYFFRGCTAYNQSVAWIDTSACTNMQYMFYLCTAFNQSLAAFDVSLCTNMTNMLYLANAWSTANYDATLIAWAALTVQSAVAFHAGDAKYSAGAATTARGVLTGAPNNWVITDGGQV